MFLHGYAPSTWMTTRVDPFVDVLVVNTTPSYSPLASSLTCARNRS